MAILQFPTRPREDEMPEGEVLAGKYRVERVLGSGAMGVVVRVTRVEGDGVFALKLLRPSVTRDPVAAKRFLREAEAAGRIESPHVVKIPDMGELATGTPYLVMEYLDGSTLEERLAGGKSLPVVEACELGLQAAEGLAAAHAMGVVHRDIKPSNLYLTTGPDGAELLKIVDFGVSKILDPVGTERPRLTRGQALLGSPLYMSPEQMRSASSAGFRADQWSLGAVLYRMLTGQRPFDAEALTQVCVQVLTGDFLPIASHRSDVPAALGAAIERCLRLEPDERYPDIAELACALAPFAGPTGRERAERCRQILDARR
jgi:eukaryotic-like serine/threonine-protein kinase